MEKPAICLILKIQWQKKEHTIAQTFLFFPCHKFAIVCADVADAINTAGAISIEPIFAPWIIDGIKIKM